MNPNKKVPKNPHQNFDCTLCHYSSSNKKDYLKHCSTRKHKILMNPNEKSPDHNEKNLVCECGKQYKHQSSLLFHKKTCNYKVEESHSDESFDSAPTEIQFMFLEMCKQNQELNKQNQEFKSQLMEFMKTQNDAPKTSETTMNNCYNTTNNNRFNLNFFLNEQCKDALNLTEFINSLKITLSDLENVGKLGFSEGISKIFVNGLKELDITLRPIHCSDLKREVIYIKDSDAWEKETERKDKLTNAIKQISHKSIKQIPLWKQTHPDCNESESKQNDQYLKIISHSMGGYTKEEDDLNYNKIIKTLAKEVVIEKV